MSLLCYYNVITKTIEIYKTITDLWENYTLIMETSSGITISSLLGFYTGTYRNDSYYNILKKRFNRVTDKPRQPGL